MPIQNVTQYIKIKTVLTMHLWPVCFLIRLWSLDFKNVGNVMFIYYKGIKLHKTTNVIFNDNLNPFDLFKMNRRDVN